MTYQIFEFYPELPFRVITKECDTLMEVYEHITELKEHKTPYAVLRDGRAVDVSEAGVTIKEMAEILTAEWKV